VNKNVSSFLAAFAVLTVTAPAHAYVRETTNWNPSSLPIPYAINQATIPSTLGTSAGVAAVEGGFATWAAPACTSWRATDTGNTSTTANTGDRHNVIMWLTSWPAELGDVTSVIGVTTPVWSSGGYFIDADIQFNAQYFRWNTTGTGGASSVDAQSIATHEEGHFLGLDHTTVRGAIMYPSYSGGLVRNLGADDQSGVCAIYPSGVAATDSGVHPTDAGTSSSDPCAGFSDTCADCTQYNGCGFCGATGQCVTGTSRGPQTGTCASGYAWLPSDCTATTPTDAGVTGGARFGDPCMQPTDCATGGICVGTPGATSGFCTRACADDCSCPDAYTCYNAGSISVCIPGANTCATNPDAAVLPGEDAAVLPGYDSGTITPGDASTVLPGDDGGTTTTHGTHAGGCGCTTVGARGDGMASMIGLAALGLVIARRRRTR